MFNACSLSNDVTEKTEVNLNANGINGIYLIFSLRTYLYLLILVALCCSLLGYQFKVHILLTVYLFQVNAVSTELLLTII